MNHRIRTRLTLSLLVLILAAGAIQGEQWFSPQPRVFASPRGQLALKVIPDKKEPFKKSATGICFSLDAGGKEVIRWKRQLVNVPHEVLISDYAYIAALNTWGGLGREHSLVLYGWRDGKAVVDYPLEKLLSHDEIAKHIKPGTYSRHWTQKAEFEWRQMGGTSLFQIQFSWGKRIVFELSERKNNTVEVKMKVSYLQK